MFFVNFLAKVLYCPKKTNPVFAKVLYCTKKNQKNQFFQVLGPRSAICLSIRLVFLRQYSTFTKKDWFFWDSTVFLLIFLQKCCTVPKKPIFFCKSAVLSQKNLYCSKKTNLFQSCCPARSQDLKRLVFFGTVQHFSKKRLVFLGQYSVFVNFFAKVLYCPKKTNLFLQKCCTVPKKPKKNNLFQSCCPARSQDLKRLFFLVFLGQYSTLAKKDWFFWDSTVFLLIFLQKCCTVPKKPIFFCKSAVLFQKNQSCGRPVVGSSLKTGKNCFFWFFGTVQHFCKKGLVFLGQYSVFVNFLTNVLYCPKKNNHLLQKWSCRTSLTGSVP